MTFDKPTYLGFFILESSKMLMYKFHYDILQLCYDGLPSHFRSENGECNLILHYMDTSYMFIVANQK